MRSHALRPVLKSQPSIRRYWLDCKLRGNHRSHAPSDVQTQTVAAVKQGKGLHAAPSQSYKAFGVLTDAQPGCMLESNRGLCCGDQTASLGTSYPHTLNGLGNAGRKAAGKISRGSPRWRGSFPECFAGNGTGRWDKLQKGSSGLGKRLGNNNPVRVDRDRAPVFHKSWASSLGLHLVIVPRRWFNCPQEQAALLYFATPHPCDVQSQHAPSERRWPSSTLRLRVAPDESVAASS
jgi:hypothetical protein